MDKRQLQYFLEICKCGNLSQAAKKCHVSPQGISMAIFRLEDELSCRLFKRTPKGSSMTEHAELLLPYAEKIMTLFSECEDCFIRNRQMKQTLTVYFAYGTLSEFATPIVKKWRDENHDILLDIQEKSELLCDSAVEKQDAELALTIGPIDEQKFEDNILFSVPDCRHAVIVYKSHPLAQKETISVNDLRGIPVVLLNDETKTGSVFISLCKEAGFTPMIYTKVGEALSIFDMAENNVAVGISTTYLAKRLHRENVRAIPFDDNRFTWRILLIKKKNTHLSPPARLFEKMLLQNKKVFTQKQA